MLKRQRQRKFSVFLNDRIYHIYQVINPIGNTCSALRVRAGTQTLEGSMAGEYTQQLLLNDILQNHRIGRIDDHYWAEMIEAHRRQYAGVLILCVCCVSKTSVTLPPPAFVGIGGD
ncbi:hypothetical protein E2C01_014759 [Portunus trituberculatus]|uniref:Uncharacterized protein n=1 Tax=Portunus trituberculatus TaxID=210409 RepID=A0A5B7DKT1_PORTR|nr:hypothetical protein [Portunus trituberculatus]